MFNRSEGFHSEGFEGGVKSGWISIGNRWGSLFQICGPITSTDLPSSVARRADDLTMDPLIADLSPRPALIKYNFYIWSGRTRFV